MGLFGGSKSYSTTEQKDQRRINQGQFGGANTGLYATGFGTGATINSIEALQTGSHVAVNANREIALTAMRSLDYGKHALDKNYELTDRALDYAARNDQNLFTTINNIIDKSNYLATNAMNLKSGETLAQPTNRTISELAPLAVVTAGIIATAIVLPKVL